METSINSIQDSVISEFELFEDWMEKYNYLIDLAKEVPPIDPAFRTEEYVIRGCQSRVWLNAEPQDGRIFFTADSDAIITKGIIALLIRILSGKTPEEILAADLYFIDRIGLSQNLSPTRSNGLLAMVKQMKFYALAYQSRFQAGQPQ